MLAIPRKQRAMVRKGIQRGLLSEIDDNVNRFFAVYATTFIATARQVCPNAISRRLPAPSGPIAKYSRSSRRKASRFQAS